MLRVEGGSCELMRYVNKIIAVFDKIVSVFCNIFMIALSMGAAGLYGLKMLHLSPSIMGSQLFAGLNSFSMIAIPLFIFMGALMSKTCLLYTSTIPRDA